MKKKILLLSVFAFLSLVLITISCDTRNEKSEGLSLGSLLVLSGQYKSFGDIARKGIKIAQQHIASQKGRPLKVLTYDHQFDKDVAKEKLALLHAKGVKYIAEIQGSGICQELLPMVEKNDMIVLSGADTSVDLTDKGGDRFFRIISSDGVAALKAVDWLKEMGLTDVILIYNTTEWGEQLARVFRREIKKQKGSISFAEGMANDQTLFSPLVEKLKKYSEKAVFLAVGPDQAGLLIKEARRQKCKNKFMGTDNFTGNEIITTGGTSLGGVMFVVPSQSSTADSEQRKVFNSLYRAQFGEEKPHIFTVYMYDVVNILYQIGCKAGNDTTKALKLLHDLDYQGASGKIRFDANNDVIVSAYQHKVFAVENGKIIRKDF